MDVCQGEGRGEASVPTESVTVRRPQRFAAESEFRAPLEQLLGAIVTLCGAEAAAVRLLEGNGANLQLVGAVGMPTTLRERKAAVDPSCGVCGDAVASNETRCSNEICACAREIAAGSADGSIQRVFAVPIHFRGAACGVLNLFLPANHELPIALWPLLPAVGDMLGLALENARLTQENLHASLMRERHMFAGEVHDSLAQNLAFMRMRTPLLRDALLQHDEARAAKYLTEVDQSLADAHSRVRELITHFRSRMDPHGLVHALSETVASLHGLGGVELDFDNRVRELSLSAEQELQVFHIVREALANIVKHAQARHGRLTLEERQGRYEITIEDDGIGLAASDVRDSERGHFGLDIMRERAQRLGGDLEFESGANHGTRMRLSFPATISRTEATL